MSLLTYVLSSLAWSGVGFALGLAVGRVARDDIDELPSTDPATAARKRRRFETVQVAAVIIVLLAITTVSSSIWAAYQSREQRECFTRVLEERGVASQRDFDAIDTLFAELVDTAVNAPTPGRLRDDLQESLVTYQTTRARNDEIRDENPITPIDSC